MRQHLLRFIKQITLANMLGKQREQLCADGEYKIPYKTIILANFLTMLRYFEILIIKTHLIV